MGKIEEKRERGRESELARVSEQERRGIYIYVV